MEEISKLECFSSVKDIVSALNHVKDLKKYKQREHLTCILFRLSLLKEYEGLLENENIVVALNDIFNKFIERVKNKNFYFGTDGEIINIIDPLEIYNVGFINSKTMIEALERLNSVGFDKLFSKEKNCIGKKLRITSLFNFELSAKKYNEENNLDVHVSEKNVKYEMYKDMEDFVYQINLINDLNKSEHRKLLFQIIMRLTNVVEYYNYMTVDFYRLIETELSKLRLRVKNSDYYKILCNPANKNNIENKVIKEILIDSRDISSSLNYIVGILLGSNSFEYEMLKAEDIISINASSIDYFKHKNNKYRILKQETGE